MPPAATRRGDDFSIGMNADGTLNIVPKEAIEAAIKMARDNTPEALVEAVLRGETDDQGANS